MELYECSQQMNSCVNVFQSLKNMVLFIKTMQSPSNLK